jgi:hypothetical protein
MPVPTAPYTPSPLLATKTEREGRSSEDMFGGTEEAILLATMSAFLAPYLE